MSVDLHFGECRSLKAKRALLRPIIEKVRRRYGASVSEVDHHDTWQRALVGVAVVGPTESHVRDVLDEIERFIWSQPDVSVLSIERRWLD